MKSKAYILLICLMLSGCFSTRRTIQGGGAGTETGDSLCESVVSFNSLYINKVKSTVILDGESYDAKVNLYYVPDSIIFLSAANTGFEIVRAAITPDSLVFINRIDRIVYTLKENALGYKAPLNFADIEYLLNKELICKGLVNSTHKDGEIVIDISQPNIRKKITYSSKELIMSRFEFFHKKTGEYIVGERSGDDSVFVYSNYLFDDVMITAVGGEQTYNESIKIDLSYNKNKYFLITE